jgi:antitoxin (DNA-binding transcriptional repressor) of toxin-antitoxin stability system
VQAVETGQEEEIIIARNGRPVARLAPLKEKRGGVRIGIAKGEFEAPENTDALDGVIAEMFYGKDRRRDR